jgi:hypothetical protein
MIIENYPALISRVSILARSKNTQWPPGRPGVGIELGEEHFVLTSKRITF